MGSLLDMLRTFMVPAVTGVFVVLWYLLRRHDSSRAGELRVLDARIHAAEKSLSDLRIELAKEYVSHRAMREAIAPIERDLFEMKADIKKLLARGD